MSRHATNKDLIIVSTGLIIAMCMYFVLTMIEIQQSKTETIQQCTATK